MCSDRVRKRGREAGVQAQFSRHLQHALNKMYGPNVSYLVGDWDGNNDRYFGDKYFGTGARNVLIEFKSTFNDLEKEAEKPLRRLFCKRLRESLAMYDLADECHFAAWGSPDPNSSDLQVFLSFYSRICGRRRSSPPFDDLLSNSSPHEGFVGQFLSGMRGADNQSFVEYLKFLARLAGEFSGRIGFVEDLDLNITWIREKEGRFVEQYISDLDSLLVVATRIEKDMEAARLEQHALNRKFPGPAFS